MTDTQTARRIYVACLASYNSGCLHGRWLDVSGRDAGDIRDDIAAILRTSPYPNVTVLHDGERVPSAEEFAIHDSDGFGDLVGEYTSVESVAAICEALDAGHGVGLRWLVQDRGMVLAEALDNCEEVQWVDATRDSAAADYMAELTEDTGYLDAVPKHLRPYIDFDAMARDATLNGDVDLFDDPDEGRVLITNAAAL